VILRRAREDAATAVRLSGAGRVDRADDLDAAQIRAKTRLGNVDTRWIRTLERQTRALIERRYPIDEGDDDVALTGLHRHAQVPRFVGTVARLPLLGAGADRLRYLRDRRTRRLRRSRGFLAGRRRRRRRRLSVWIGGRHALARTDSRQRERADALAVDADLEHLRLGVERQALIQVACQTRANLVDRVHRERIADARPAARAERQAGQLDVLREI